MTRQHLLFAAISCAVISFANCTKSHIEPMNCENSQANVQINNEVASLQITSSNLMRYNRGAGTYKMLNLEAQTDSVKVFMNVHDGYYETTEQLQMDSIRLRTYTFTQASRLDTAGAVVLGIRQNNTFVLHLTDSSSVTITAVDRIKRTVSGSYFVRTQPPVSTVSGTFSQVCFQSIF